MVLFFSMYLMVLVLRDFAASINHTTGRCEAYICQKETDGEKARPPAHQQGSKFTTGICINRILYFFYKLDTELSR